MITLFIRGYLYFPVILNTDKEVLIIGGGNVALRKTKKLLGFTENITIISSKFQSEFDSINVKKIKKEITEDNFSSFLSEKIAFVVLSLNDKELNKKLSNICNEHKIMVNVVDDKDISDIIFPAVIQKDNLLISISTKGECPFYSKKLKEEIEEFIDKKDQDAKILIESRKKGNNLDDTYNKIKRGL